MFGHMLCFYSCVCNLCLPPSLKLDEKQKIKLLWPGKEIVQTTGEEEEYAIHNSDKKFVCEGLIARDWLNISEGM